MNIEHFIDTIIAAADIAVVDNITSIAGIELLLIIPAHCRGRLLPARKALRHWRCSSRPRRRSGEHLAVSLDIIFARAHAASLDILLIALITIASPLTHISGQMRCRRTHFTGQYSPRMPRHDAKRLLRQRANFSGRSKSASRRSRILLVTKSTLLQLGFLSAGPPSIEAVSIFSIFVMGMKAAITGIPTMPTRWPIAVIAGHRPRAAFLASSPLPPYTFR